MKTWRPRRTLAVCAYLGALLVQHPRPHRHAVAQVAMTASAHPAAPLPRPLPAWMISGPARRRVARSLSVLKAAARRYRLPWRLVAAVALTESRGHRRARSQTGALGLLQVMPIAAGEVNMPYATWQEQVMAGTSYLRYLQGVAGVTHACAMDGPGGSVACRWRTDVWISAYYTGPGHRVRWGYVDAIRTRWREVA